MDSRVVGLESKGSYVVVLMMFEGVEGEREDIEFASLDSTSSGFSLIESAFSSPTSSPGSIEIVPLVKLGLIHGLDGVSHSSSSF